MRVLARIAGVSLLILVMFQAAHKLSLIDGAAFDWLLPVLGLYLAAEFIILSIWKPKPKRSKDE